MCPTYAAAHYLKMKKLKGKVYYIGLNDALGSSLDEFDLPCFTTEVCTLIV